MERTGNGFLLTHTLRVRYSETDKMGVVYNGNYLTWFEISRTELCRNFGTTYREWEDRGFMLPVVEAHCRYKRPAQYDDLISLYCRTPVEQIKPQSVLFEYQVCFGNAQLIAEGWTKHAFVNREGKLFRRENPFQAWLLQEAQKHLNV